MSEIVLDASALLAQINNEPGGDLVAEVIQQGASVSAVNLSEVVAKLSEAGMPEPAVRELLNNVKLTIVDFDREFAFRAGLLRQATRPAGLSFGDRACLALAQNLNLSVLTADRAWSRIDLGVKVQILRGY